MKKPKTRAKVIEKRIWSIRWERSQKSGSWTFIEGKGCSVRHSYRNFRLRWTGQIPFGRNLSPVISEAEIKYIRCCEEL